MRTPEEEAARTAKRTELAAYNEKYCCHVPKPIPEGWIAEQYAKGRLIPVGDLKDQAIYAGNCRNARSAMWNAEDRSFIYPRYKFGDTFLDKVNSVEDDNGFDLFLPHFEITDPLDERVVEIRTLFVQEKKGYRR